MMRLETAQIVRSAQVWVCDTCGGKDHKSCSCRSTASWEALLAKREATRRRVARHRERTNENNDDVTRYDDDMRTLIYNRMVEGLGLILASPRGRNLTDEFLRGIFEEFLTKRREVL